MNIGANSIQEQNGYFKLVVDRGLSDIAGNQYGESIFNLDTVARERQETHMFSSNYIGKCLSGWILYEVQSKGIWDAWLGKTYETDDILAASTDDIVDYGYIKMCSKGIFEDVFSCSFEMEQDRATELESEVAKKFKDVPEVEAIYVDLYLDSRRFQILTSNSRYDDELMDKLLTIEYDMKIAYRDITTSFEYIPRIYENTNEIVSSRSKLIYRRGYNVVFVGTSMAGEAEREVSEAIAR